MYFKMWEVQVELITGHTDCLGAVQYHSMGLSICKYTRVFSKMRSWCNFHPITCSPNSDRVRRCAISLNLSYSWGIQGGNTNRLDKMDVWEGKMAKDIKTTLSALKDFTVLAEHNRPWYAGEFLGSTSH